MHPTPTPGMVLIMDGADLFVGGAESATGCPMLSWRGKYRPWVCLDTDGSRASYWSPCSTKLSLGTKGIKIPQDEKDGFVRLWRVTHCAFSLSHIWRVPNETVLAAWKSGPAYGKRCSVNLEWLEQAVNEVS